MDCCTKKLIAWYDKHHRLLPWRQTRNIYHTWVCEVMSQQTTLAVVAPKFAEFVKHLPSVDDLAACDEEKLRQLWSGLGYYARARNLKKGAQCIVEQRKGNFPQSYQEWLEIPGCGPYTAAAIASICCHEKVACVDGNVIRVVSRLLALQDVWSSSGQSAIQAYVTRIQPDNRPGDFNQAMMELGATVCRKTKPQCHLCPLQEHCLAFAKNCIELCPPKKPRRDAVNVELFAVVVWRKTTDAIAIVKRTKGFLSNTVGFPLISESEVEEANKLLKSLPHLQLSELPNTFSHNITHHRISGRVFVAQEIENASVCLQIDILQHLYWVARSDITSKLSTSLDNKVLQLFHKYYDK